MGILKSLNIVNLEVEMDRVRAQRTRKHHTRCPPLDTRKKEEKPVRPKTTWRRTVELGELKTLEDNWDTIRKLALSKQQWRTFVAVPHTSKHKGGK